MSAIVSIHSHDKLPVLVSPIKPRRFKLFAKSQAKLRRWVGASWTSSFKNHKSSSRLVHPQRRRGHVLSLFMCWASDGGVAFQEKDSRDSHDRAGGCRVSSGHDAIAGQTIASSTDSVLNKGQESQGNTDGSTKEPSINETPPTRTRRRASTSSTSSVQSKRSRLSVEAPEPSQEKPSHWEQHTADSPVTALAEPTTPTLESGQDLWLLKPIATQDKGRKCLVLDLDETLVHSSFNKQAVTQADFVVPVEIDGHVHRVFVLKRPGVDTFMKRMGEMYEIVVFTASLPKYAGPVLDMFDQHRVIRHRLFRESCFNYKGTYVKDLSQLGRDLNKVIILDNSPASYIFHTANAVPVSTWFNDPHDSELIDLIPFLEDLASVDDVRDVLDNTIPGPFSYM